MPADPHPRRRGGRLLVSLLATYLVLLVWIVLWKLEPPWVGQAALLPRPIKLVPFVAAGDAGASAPPEVLANLLLFVPFGLYLGLLAPTWPAWRRVLLVAGASLALEVVQHVLSVGSLDVTDVLMNTAGGLAGSALLALARRRWRAATVDVLVRGCAVGTVLAVLAVGAYVASPIRFAQQHDVVVSGGGAR